MNPFIQHKKQLSIFITAGYPQLDSLPKQIALLEKEGVDFIEVGIPFSDPMADGPVIQETSSIALKNGMQLDLLFDQLKATPTSCPIVLMGYFNTVHRYGLHHFLQRCRETDVRTIILPDMSLEIYERHYAYLFDEYEVFPSFLITPQTPEDRIQKIAKVCENSFVYLVSGNSTTGGENSLEANQEMLSTIKSLCGDTPMFIGFGIRNRSDIEQVNKIADGAIIGTAFLRSLAENREVEFLRSLR